MLMTPAQTLLTRNLHCELKAHHLGRPSCLRKGWVNTPSWGRIFGFFRFCRLCIGRPTLFLALAYFFTSTEAYFKDLPVTASR